MTIIDYKSPEKLKAMEIEEDVTLKWRRSGGDRRSEANLPVSMERRFAGDRRRNWLDTVSAIIYPRDAKQPK